MMLLSYLLTARAAPKGKEPQSGFLKFMIDLNIIEYLFIES